ncbi:UNVERIFIED_CONTAM: hypothetical protein FKN15_016304 [Acipenser sinensis]
MQYRHEEHHCLEVFQDTDLEWEEPEHPAPEWEESPNVLHLSGRSPNVLRLSGRSPNVHSPEGEGRTSTAQSQGPRVSQAPTARPQRVQLSLLVCLYRRHRMEKAQNIQIGYLGILIEKPAELQRFSDPAKEAFVPDNHSRDERRCHDNL